MKKINNVLIIKVGTSTLIEKQEESCERLDANSFHRIGRQVIELSARGTAVALVSSAAITAGMAEAGLTVRPNKDAHMHELQRLASIGQRKVLNAWADALPEKTIGELLVTNRELSMTCERAELLRVTHTLMSFGDIPIANENDAISHEGIAFGDNDRLAATFAAQLGRSALFGRVRLVILSDVNGVYTDRHDPATIVRRIDNLDLFEHVAGGAGSLNGKGGMASKFKAARIATENGVEMWIANGRAEHAIQRALDNEIGTRFSC